MSSRITPQTMMSFRLENSSIPQFEEIELRTGWSRSKIASRCLDLHFALLKEQTPNVIFERIQLLMIVAVWKYRNIDYSYLTYFGNLTRRYIPELCNKYQIDFEASELKFNLEMMHLGHVVNLITEVEIMKEEYKDKSIE